MIVPLSLASKESIDATLSKQREAFLKSPSTTIRKRKADLKKLKAAILAYREPFKATVSEDFGYRSSHETDVLEFFGIIQSIDYMIKNLRKFMKREHRHVGLFFRAGKAYVDYQPKGVIGIMAPWNYPLSLTLIPLATALAAGNRAMVKPSELTPRTSNLIKQLIEAKGIYEQSYWNFADLLRAPFGKFADITLKLALGMK